MMPRVEKQKFSSLNLSNKKRDICEHMCALQQWNTTLPHQSLLSEI